MTIQEKDFQQFAQVRPEIVQLADCLVDLLPIRDDEHFAFARVGLIYRNQAWRECLLSGRVTSGNKCTYATYQMPNGKAYKVAIDFIEEQQINDGDHYTLRIATYDLDEHIGIPCETDYNSLQVGDSFVSLRGLVAVVKGICDKSALHKFLGAETLYNVSVDGRERVLTPLGIQNFINYR